MTHSVYRFPYQRMVQTSSALRRDGIMYRCLLALIIAMMLVVCLGGKPVFAASQVIGGVAGEGNLRIRVEDSGQMGVERYVSGSWQSQVYSTSPGSKGSKLYINGSSYKFGYYDGTQATSSSNTTSGNTITTAWTAGSTTVTQKTTYISGNAYYRLEWNITNNSGGTLSNLRFFHGQDTYLSGGDSGAGFWDAANNAIGVRKTVSGSEQRLVLQGITTPYAYESRHYSSVTSSVSGNALQNMLDANESTDNGYALEWRNDSLSPGQTWTIIAFEKFNNASVTGLSVTAPAGIECQVGSSCTMNFSVQNMGASTSSVSLSASSSTGWPTVVTSPVSPVNIGAGATQIVTVQVTVPGGTSEGATANITLTANDGTNTSSDIGGVTATPPPYVAPTAFTSSAPGGGTFGAFYSHTFTANGTPAPSYSLASGSLPGGLTLTSGGLLSGTPNAAGTYHFTIRASNIGGSFDQAYSITIQPADTTTTITGDVPDPSIYGVGTLVSVSVVSATSGTPGGSVTVSNGSQNCAITLSGGSGSCTLVSLSAGAKTLTATYAGAANFKTSSDTESHTVNKAATAVSVSRSVVSPVYGQPFDLTATVVTTNGAITPAGQVQFSINGSAVGSPLTLNGAGTATLAAGTALPAGSNSYAADYLGDGNNFGSSSTTTNFTIAKNDTTTSVVSSDNAAVYGQPFHLTATVAANLPSVVTPVGSVQFYFDGQPLGSPVTLSGGQAVSADVHTLLGAHPQVGEHSFSASYLGNSNSNASASANQPQTVDPAPTTLTVTSDASPVVYGTSVQVTVTVSAGGGSIAKPQGIVQLTVDGVNFGSPLTLNAAGSAVRTVPYLNLWPGTHLIRGFYTPASPAQFVPVDNDAAPYNQVVHKANPVITITPESGSPVASQPVQYTVKVAGFMPTQGIPTGTIVFRVNGNPVGGPYELDGNGETVQSVVLSAGAHEITVSYNGDDYFLAVPASTPLNRSVSKADSTTQILSVAPSAVVVGQPFTVQVQVRPVSPAIGIPGGTVEVSNGTENCTATLDASGAGSCQIVPTQPGSFDLSATYTGSSEFNYSSATAFAGPTVSKADSAVAITGFSPASPVAGQPITVQFQVSPVSPGAGVPTGSVTVTGAGGETCSASVGGPTSTGSCQVTFTHSGSVTLNAQYVGDSRFNASSTSSPAGLTVAKAATSLALASSGSPSVYGQPVHFTATLSVTAPGAGIPGGTVQFTLDGSPFGSPVSITGGQAVSAEISSLDVGLHTVGATYLGSDDFSGSSAPAINQVVNKADTTLVLTSSRNPSPYGQSVLVTATLTQVPPSGAAPAGGSVQFIVDGLPYGSPVALGANSQASKILPYTALWVGTHPIRAVYSGSSNFNGSDNLSSPLMQVVIKGETTITLAPTVSNPVFGQSFGFTTTITGVGANVPKPAGTVQFAVDGVNLGVPVTLDDAASAVSILTGSLSVGKHAVSLSYSGDDYYASATINQSEGVEIFKANVNAEITNTPFAAVVVGQPVTVNFAVTAAAPGVGTPTGQVTISNGVDTCSASVAAGFCILTPSTPGSPAFSLAYAGDNNFNAAGPLTFPGPQVTPAPTNLVISAAVNPLIYGNSALLTVTVAANPPSNAVPQGTVQLKLNGINLGLPLNLDSDGKVNHTILYSNLWPAAHAITGIYTPAAPARFVGSDNLASPYTLTVHKATPVITINPNVANPLATESVLYTVTVAGSLPTQGTPSGTVRFLVDGLVNGTALTLNGSGMASRSISLPTGDHTIQVEYSGDSYFYAVPASPAINVTTVKADSNTAILSISPSNVEVGQPVTVNVRVQPVAPAAGIPSGSVSVTNGTDTCTVIALDGSGDGSCQLVPGNPGNPSLTASYSGDVNFKPSVSPAYPGPVVARFNASLVLNSFSPASPLVGQAVTFNFSASPVAPGFGVPTGLVTITAGPGLSCNATLAAGSCSITFTHAGAYNLIASYAGDTNFNPVTNPAVAGPVVAPAATNVEIVTSGSPSMFSQPVSFTATVTANAPGGGVPTGLVQFRLNGSNLGDPVALTGGAAVLTNVSSLAVGSHTVDAQYLGSADYLASSVASLTQTVNPANPMLTLVSNPNPAAYGVPVLVTATLSPVAPATAAPTEGTVTFYVDTVQFGDPVFVGSDGKAAALLPYTSLLVGTHSITASFSGTTNFNAATSVVPVSQVIEKGQLTIGLATSVASPVFGQPFHFTATVIGSVANVPKPSGTVQFSVDDVALGGSLVLDSNGAVSSPDISSLTAGGHKVTVAYSGDATYVAYTQTYPVGVHISKANTVGSITNASFAEVVVGQPFTVNFSVAAQAPGAGTPGGTVTISNGTDTCSAPVSAGSCSFKSSLAGTRSLTLSYSGDANFNPVTADQVNGPAVQKASLALSIQSVNPSAVVVGQPYLVSALVQPVAPGTLIPVGAAVTIGSGSGSCTATIQADGSAACQLTPNEVGTFSLTASVSGLASYLDAVSPAANGPSVARAATITGLTPSVNPVVLGGGVQFTAKVQALAPGGGIPGGTVQFQVDGVNLGDPVALVNGEAVSPMVNDLSLGNHVVGVEYSGDANYLASQSTSLTEQVVNASASGMVTPQGGLLTFTETVNGKPLTTTITVPAGAVSSNVTLVLRQFHNSSKIPPAGKKFVSNFTLEVYANGVLQPGYVFAQRVSVATEYNPVGINEDSLEVHGWNGAAWSTTDIGVSNRDKANDRITFTFTSTAPSEFALVGSGAYGVFIPAVIKP